MLLWMMTRLAPSIRIGHLRDLSDVQLGANKKIRFSSAFVNVPSRRGNLRGLANQIRQGISSSAKSRTSVPGTAHECLAPHFE